MTTPLLPREEWLKTLPRKRMAAACLLECTGKFLVVKPNYKEWWLLPGGGMDALESPLTNIKRELREELGLEVTPTRLLAIDYHVMPPANDILHEKIDFLFYAPLTQTQFAAISLQATELTDKKLIVPDEFAAYLPSWQAKRAATALRALRENRTIYAQEGLPIL
jgi:8-oxo-dGTP diphosphatase